MFLLPAAFSSIPRQLLLYPQPSPIESLSRLSSHLGTYSAAASSAAQSVDNPGAKPQIWIKREDSNSGLAGGGNKIRKLEYVIPDALSQGATVLVTTGGLQSNHMRQVAAVAAKLGLKTHLIPQDRGISDQPEYKSLGNIQITHILSAEHVAHNSPPEKVMQSIRDGGEIPYWIPSGASTHPLGGLGFARFAFEIAYQEDQLKTFFDTIIVACASGSTLGGMIAGFKLLSSIQESASESNSTDIPRWLPRPRKVVGIDCYASPAGETEKLVLDIARGTASKLGLSEEVVQAADVTFDDRWSAGRYGYVDQRTKEAMKLMAGLEGILLDPVYSAKAMAGLIGMVEKGELKDVGNVLFVHTGGVYALSAYPDVR